MKAIRILSIIGIIIGTTLITSSSYLLFFANNSEETTIISEQPQKQKSSEIEEDQLGETDEENIQPTVLKESGWIPNWAFLDGYESLVNNKGIIDTVNPVLYTINSNGEIESRGVSETNLQKLISYCEENNIRIIPTVASYDYNSMSNSLNNTDTSSKNIYFVIDEIEKYSFDGIDLDYEMINSSDKNNYLTFLEELESALEKKEKTLSVTVFPQWGNATYHEKNKESILAQDYKKIGEIADEVRIMGYDYTLQSSSIPGPIGPLDWITRVLDYATKYIPSEKIWLGVHLYSYEWVGEKTVALTYTSVNNILKNPNISSSFNNETGEWYAEFGCESGLRCVMYYQDSKGIGMRRDIAKEYDIAGLSYWRLGGEMDILK